MREIGMGGHQRATMLKDEWLTPPEIIEALGGSQSFDLDPCSPIKRPWDTAKDDGGRRLPRGARI